jgi:hypothetical protein
MGKGYIGESRGERAMNKIVNYIERQDRKRQDGEPQKYEGNSLVDQLKAAYGKDWEHELEEIRREHRDPQYKAAKDKVRAEAKQRYWSQPRRERDDSGITEGTYVARALNAWRKDYK